ncbi:MAG: thiamine-phosphate kinase [Candidatus Gygaella obscura]|nr:thiamine-phosphate kinase [Candidatus Gygaella obscura]
MKLTHLGEDKIIEFFKKNNRCSKKVLVGIGDDAAVVRIDKNVLLSYSCDMFTEGTHFLRNDDSFLVGAKAISACISDLSAMGSNALFASASLGVPSDMDFTYIKRLYAGLTKTAKRFKVDLVTGDTVRAKKIVLDVSIIGRIFKRPILRSGARKGDYIFVSGSLGKAFYNRGFSVHSRMSEADYLTRNYNIHAMIDVSDGLYRDLSRICKQSNKGAILSKENIPLYKKSSVDHALFKGEDFELLFCVSSSDAHKLIRQNKYRFSCIGRVVDASYGVSVVDHNFDIRILNQDLSFKHF